MKRIYFPPTIFCGMSFKAVSGSRNYWTDWLKNFSFYRVLLIREQESIFRIGKSGRQFELLSYLTNCDQNHYLRIIKHSSQITAFLTAQLFTQTIVPVVTCNLLLYPGISRDPSLHSVPQHVTSRFLRLQTGSNRADKLGLLEVSFYNSFFLELGLSQR